MKCPVCGSTNPDKNEFCSLCYQPLKLEQPAPKPAPEQQADSMWHEPPAANGATAAGFMGAAAGVPRAAGGAAPVGPGVVVPGGPPRGGPPPNIPITPVSGQFQPMPPPGVGGGFPGMPRAAAPRTPGFRAMSRGGQILAVIIVIPLVLGVAFAIYKTSVSSSSNPYSHYSQTTAGSSVERNLSVMESSQSWQATVTVDKDGKKTQKGTITHEREKGFVIQVFDDAGNPARVVYRDDSPRSGEGTYIYDDQSKTWIAYTDVPEVDLSSIPDGVGSSDAKHNGVSARCYEFSSSAGTTWGFLKEYGVIDNDNFKAKVWCDTSEITRVSEIQLSFETGKTMDIQFSQFGTASLAPWNVPVSTSPTSQNNYYYRQTTPRAASTVPAQPESKVTISSVTPNSAPNTGFVRLKISGTGFQPGMSISLEKTGTTIPGSAIVFSGTDSFTSDFNLQGVPAGLYHMSMVINGQPFATGSIFEVTSPSETN